MNQLRNGGYRSVHTGQQQLSHDIKAMLTLGGGGHEHDINLLLRGPGDRSQLATMEPANPFPDWPSRLTSGK